LIYGVPVGKAGFCFGAIMNTDLHIYRKKMKSKEDKWYRLKMACLKRDRFMCQRCEKKNSQGRGMTAHHITPRSEDGADDLGNLITLCDPCHDYVEVNDLRSRALIIGSYEDNLNVSISKPTQEINDEGYHFERPEWHKWVYGGHKKPQ
jgi:hypothetical protein